ncbi:MAG: HAMP domain-containing histidine kinase [Deltaproteobacteria bacterium]|nr:HAMP domain-containing histidine kinase [Deltaproteobacteria bacterium]
MAHLAFLILSAMLLMNVAMIKFAEKHLIQTKLQTGRLLLNSLKQLVSYEIACRNRSWEELKTDSRFKAEVDRLLGSGEYSGALLLDGLGMRIFSTGTWEDAEKSAVSLSRECVSTRERSFDFFGSAWGIFWLAHERVNMSAPVLVEGRLVGVTTIGASLRPLYQRLRATERVVLIYILLNTIILVLFGLHLLSRTVVKPIHGLLTITEEFKDAGSVPPLEDSSPNEIGRLFRSLNMMLKRLEQNKKELKEYISSLEKANQEIKNAQDEIIKSEKLASVGRLATGVAHEIGNPIGIVLGYLDLLKNGDLNNEDGRDFLDRMESEITRINQIIRDLLDFSRSSSGDVKAVNVHELILETLEMLKPQPMMAHIRMQPVLDAPKDMVWADSNQLKQVFLNIIMNAADAMGENALTPDAVSADILTIQTENRGDSIAFRFMDTGPGIQREELVRIFDPFYTTKEPGKGTGLGLSVCYRIVEGLGGEIRAESTPGKGTTIIVKIPLYEEMQVHPMD